MTAPTRTQITADVTLPTYQVEVYVSGSWYDVSAYVTNVDIDIRTTGDASGLSFGSAVTPTASVQLMDVGTVLIDDTPNRLIDTDGMQLLDSAIWHPWELTPIRISFGFSTSTLLPRFSGVITARSRNGAIDVTWECRGWDAIIESTTIRSPAFIGRMIATKTTPTQSDDPSTISTYTGGIINYILWQCGGRPYEQAASYPSATFYYSCANSLIAPAYSWIAGEGSWEALLRFVRAAGGQMYQDSLGVMRYTDPFSMNTGSSTHHFTDEVLTAAQRASGNKTGYQAISSRASTEQALSAVNASYVTRVLQGSQQVYEDTIPRYLAVGASVVIDLDLQLPIAALSFVGVDTIEIQSATFVAHNRSTVSWSAQRVTIIVTNTHTRPIQIERIYVIAQPIAVEEEGTASYSATGTLQSNRTLTLEDSPWVQDRRHAEQLCRMAWDLYSNVGEVITISGCAYDPDRTLGELVSLTCADWDLNSVLHRIVGIRPYNGSWMDVDLCAVGNLPTIDDVWVIGTTYGPTATRRISY